MSDEQTIQEMLLLVDLDVPIYVIRKMSEKVRAEVCFWAGATAMRASDNNCRVPPMPEVLKQFKRTT